MKKAMFDAARCGILAQVRELITAANVEELDEAELRTPLHHACWGGHADVVEYLLNVGAKVHSRDGRGDTPLYICAARGHAACMELLVANGGVDLVADGARGALHVAARRGHAAVVRLLLNAAPGMKSVLDYVSSLPLHEAAVGGHVECLQLLLMALPDSVGAANMAGRTPLHFAAECGSLECCRLLIDAGSELEPKDMQGCTPLQYAFRKHHRAVAECLLARGAKVDSAKAVPNWVPKWVEQRNHCFSACRAAASAILQLKARCSSVIGASNGKDVLMLVAAVILETRQSWKWVRATKIK